MLGRCVRRERIFQSSVPAPIGRVSHPEKTWRYLAVLFERAYRVRLFETVEEVMTAVSSEGRRQGNSGPSESEERNLRDSTCLAFRPARHSVIVIIMSEPDTNTDATTSPSSVNGLTESLSSLSDDLEHLRSLLAHDIPGDAADQEIGAWLQELERADSIGENVEERIDGILETLD